MVGGHSKLQLMYTKMAGSHSKLQLMYTAGRAQFQKSTLYICCPLPGSWSGPIYTTPCMNKWAEKDKKPLF